jgi:hypothetical protein
MNGGGEIFAGRKVDRATAGIVTFLNGLVDGGGVVREAAGGRAEVQDVIGIGGKCMQREMGWRERIGGFGCARGGESDEQDETYCVEGFHGNAFEMAIARHR